jgi:putative FmdB family regulatory protein
VTYDYICEACKHEWEEDQKITADPIAICPQCGKETAKRLISGGTGFILNGGGWYKDGYKSTK